MLPGASQSCFWGVRTQAELHVDCGGGTLEDAKRLDDGRRHAVLRLVDLEVLQRPLRLRAPVLVGRHLDLAKGVTFCPRGGHAGGGCEETALGDAMVLQLTGTDAG
jgi:hypothetical protein